MYMKKMAAVLLILVMAFTLTSCLFNPFGRSGNSSGNPPAAGPSPSTDPANDPETGVEGTYALEEVRQNGMHFFADGSAFVTSSEITNHDEFGHCFAELSLLYDDETYQRIGHEIADTYASDAENDWEWTLIVATEAFRLVGHPVNFENNVVTLSPDGSAELDFGSFYTFFTEENIKLTATWRLEGNDIALASDDPPFAYTVALSGDSLIFSSLAFQEAYGIPENMPVMEYVFKRTGSAAQTPSGESDPAMLPGGSAPGNLSEQLLGTWSVDLEKTLPDEYFAEAFADKLPVSITFYSDGTGDGSMVLYYAHYTSYLTGTDTEGVHIGKVGRPDLHTRPNWETLEPEGLLKVGANLASDYYFDVTIDGDTMVTTCTEEPNVFTETGTVHDVTKTIYWNRES